MTDKTDEIFNKVITEKIDVKNTIELAFKEGKSQVSNEISEMLDNIVPFAELDELRWKELINEIKAQIQALNQSQQTKPESSPITNDTPTAKSVISKDKPADYIQTKQDISLCKNCNCMTKNIRGRQGYYCGKCHAFKFETKQEKK